MHHIVRHPLLILALLLTLSTRAQQDVPIDQNLNTRTLAASLVERLNVRSIPSTTGVIITVIERNEIYDVTGRNEDASWYQIAVAGTRGWVAANLVAVNNPQLVPIAGDEAREAFVENVTNNPNVGGRNFIGVTANLNIRTGPSVGSALLGRIPFQDQARVIARTSLGNWYLVNYGGTVGWVSANFIILPPDYIAPTQQP
jgi:probable enterotoxin B